jgi:predicted RND superfamily exporter protein
MVKDISLTDAREMKARIAAIPGVKSVLWLDDVTDISKPEAFIDPDARDNYYKDDCALYELEFTGDDYSVETSTAIRQIRALDTRILMAGNAVNSLYMKDVLSGEMFKIIAIVVPICIVILMLASYSWLEPALYLLVIGISIAINMGTNAFYSSVSFITFSMAAVLQLAVSMDYSIFLLHRYFEERDHGLSVREAVVRPRLPPFLPLRPVR